MTGESGATKSLLTRRIWKKGLRLNLILKLLTLMKQQLNMKK